MSVVVIVGKESWVRLTKKERKGKPLLLAFCHTSVPDCTRVRSTARQRLKSRDGHLAGRVPGPARWASPYLATTHSHLKRATIIPVRLGSRLCLPRHGVAGRRLHCRIGLVLVLPCCLDCDLRRLTAIQRRATVIPAWLCSGLRLPRHWVAGRKLHCRIDLVLVLFLLSRPRRCCRCGRIIPAPERHRSCVCASG